MKRWCTTITAICPVTKELKKFEGKPIEAPSPALAHEFCQTNGLGYLEVTGDELISEIPCKSGTFEPDWDKRVDYDHDNN